MTEQFADLGSVAVLDAHRLVVGSYITINGCVCQVERIIDGHVYLTIVKGHKLFMYRMRHLWHENRVPLIITAIIAVLVFLAHYYLDNFIERFF